MSKLTGNQGFNGDVYIKGVGDYTGNNPDSSSPLHEVIQSLLNKINAFTSHGVSSIVALTESEYAALTTKDATTLYIVKPNPFPLTGTGTQDDPIVGWYENVACVVNSAGTSASGTYTATIEGVYDFLSNILGQGEPTSYYFSYNNSVIDIVISKTGSKISSQTITVQSKSLPILNAESVMSSYFTVNSSDLITFYLTED